MIRLPGRTIRRLFGSAVVFASLVGFVVLAKAMDFSRFDAAWADASIHNQGARGVLLYMGLAAVASALAMPRQLLSFLGGYAFGAGYGALWATAGTTLGCGLGFFYSRFVGRSFVTRLFARRVQRLNSFLTRSPFSMVLIIRLLPVGNNAVTNLLGGLTAIPAPSFIAGSCVGYIPQNLIFSILGSGMLVESSWRIIFSLVLFIFSTALGYMLYRRHRVEQVLAASPHRDQ